MYAIHDVFVSVGPTARFKGPVRVIDSIGLRSVVLISIDEKKLEAPFRIPYDEWVDLLNDQQIEKAEDPFLTLTSTTGDLPPGAEKRLKAMLEVASHLTGREDLFHAPRTLPNEIATVAEKLQICSKTVKRWTLAWLRSGRNPVAAVSKFVGRESKAAARLARGSSTPSTSSVTTTSCSLQQRGMKRGARSCRVDAGFVAPAHEVATRIHSAYARYIVEKKRTWRDAYFEMLISDYGVPANAIDPNEKDFFLEPALLHKLRPPSWPQFRYRCRQFKKFHRAQTGSDLPRGKRGKATDGVLGPGYFEIDATYFQVQLVSSLTKAKLVSRPAVYLIVDIFSGAIVGYAISLENPSWAVAALALNNAFSDKGPVFERLGLPYQSSDWPCSQLPTVLRADRAELISNMGQEFPSSGIRVEITPSMTPIAKGTVEGKHSEIKRERIGRFNLPGRYQKVLKRRQSNGKKEAALNLIEFERIIVEMILDINRSAVDPRRIPLDAYPKGGNIASRIGMYEWGLQNRPGFTRNMPNDFAYEHLMTKGKARVTPYGLLFKGECYQGDQLRKGGYRDISRGAEIDVQVVYNPILAAEVFFFDMKTDAWHVAYNTDPEVEQHRASFAELKQWRATQRALSDQASLNARATQLERDPKIRASVKAAEDEAAVIRQLGRSNSQIRRNRSEEKGIHRSSGLNGALPTADAMHVENTLRETASEKSMASESITSQTSTAASKDPSKSVDGFMKLWESLNVDDES